MMGDAFEINGPYIPRVYQGLHDTGTPIIEPGKGHKPGKKQKVRLKHRPDVRKHIKSEGFLDGFILSPVHVNPGKASSAILKLSVETFWHKFQHHALDGIVGQVNDSPVLQFEGLEQYTTENCLLREGCSFSTGHCKCIWRPNQLVTWGRIINGSFTALLETEVVSSSWVSMYELRDSIEEMLSVEDWEKFSKRESKLSDDLVPMNATQDKKDQLFEEIAAQKIANNLRTMQRVDFHTANCYGLAFYQFDICIDSMYADDGFTLLFRLSVNKRVPSVESKHAASVRLKHDVVDIEQEVKEEIQ